MSDQVDIAHGEVRSKGVAARLGCDRQAVNEKTYKRLKRLFELCCQRFPQLAAPVTQRYA